jgi:hypothetical protein
VRLIKGPDAGSTGRLVKAARHRMIVELDGEPVPVAVSPGWVQLDPAEVDRFTDPPEVDTDALAVLAAWQLTPTGTFTRHGGRA